MFSGVYSLPSAQFSRLTRIILDNKMWENLIDVVRWSAQNMAHLWAYLVEWKITNHFLISSDLQPSIPQTKLSQQLPLVEQFFSMCLPFASLSVPRAHWMENLNRNCISGLIKVKQRPQPAVLVLELTTSADDTGQHLTECILQKFTHKYPEKINIPANKILARFNAQLIILRTIWTIASWKKNTCSQ